MGMWIMGAETSAQFYMVKDGNIVYQLEEGTVDYIALERPIKTDFVGEAVDMGLSVKWSSVNVGARTPEEPGIFVAWGETEAKDIYNWSTYKHLQEGETEHKYINKYQIRDGERGGGWYDYEYNFIGDGKTTLDPEDDVAHVNWGGGWVMPTQADWVEIYENCSRKWTIQNEVYGYEITGSNGNSIFLPAAGYRYGGPLYGEGANGYYWSSSLNEYYSSNGRCLYFYSGDFNPWYHYYRYSGFSVRPVCPSAGDTNGHVAVDLGLPSGMLWASCNVGASEPEASGDYFAWGETEPKEVYSLSTYKHIKEGSNKWQDINKYTADDGQIIGSIWYRAEEFVGDGKTTLEAADDAATVCWGENWRMPTAKEWEELTNEENCTWTWKEVNGVRGYEVVSKITGNSIFLPAGYNNWKGSFTGTGPYGYYWSSSLDDSDSHRGRCLYFYDYYESISLSTGERRYGYSVRPVQE